MLKHATINRTNRAQQTLQLQKQWEQSQQTRIDLINSSSPSLEEGDSYADGDNNSSDLNNNNNKMEIVDNLFDRKDELKFQSLIKNATILRTPSPALIANDQENDNHSLTMHHRQQNQSAFPAAAATPPPPGVIATGGNNIKPPKLPSSLMSSPISSTANFMQSKWRSNGISSLPTTPLKKSHLYQSNSNNKTNNNNNNNNCNSESMIKIFAQTLSQDVEYITLHVNTQTKCEQIIKSLLKKFRLKHRDPNLFYITLERLIRKDGLKCKNTIILRDDACPMQYQQCCSNPPYNDIKFTLQMKSGALVKIYCFDVVPETRYKCLSLATETSVEQTIELMLHCLNLIPTHNSKTVDNNTQTTTNNHHHQQQQQRDSASPSSTSSSTNSSTSSSSGIDSDLPPTVVTTLTTRSDLIGGNNYHHSSSSQLMFLKQQQHLNENSRASSTNSISSWSNVSTISNSILDQYCLTIECQDSNFKRTLEADEYLVDVYQSLLLEAKEQEFSFNSTSSSLNKSDQHQEQWFFIKLKRRYDLNSSNLNNNSNNNNSSPAAIKLFSTTSTICNRQSIPLPPIPSSSSLTSITQLNNINNANDLKHIVSTTQIEVRSKQSTSNLMVAAAAASFDFDEMMICKPLLFDKQQEQSHKKRQQQQLNNNNINNINNDLSNSNNNNNSINLSCDVVDSGNNINNNSINNNDNNKDDVDGQQLRVRNPPPPALIYLPPIRPRRRNLSNASSTFMPNNSSNINANSSTNANGRLINKRRYDPAQLEADLSKLNMNSCDNVSNINEIVESNNLNTLQKQKQDSMTMIISPSMIRRRESIVIDNSTGTILENKYLPETSLKSD